MSRRKIRWTIRSLVMGILAVAVLFSSNAQAGDDPALAGLVDNPQALLEELDSRHNAFKDQILRVKMILRGGSNDGKELEFSTYTKGDSRRAVRFHKPADLRGMGVVIKGSNEIYVRLPDSKKVRRVAAHAKKQTFMGSDYNFDDMGIIRLVPLFTPTLLKKDDKHIWLELTRKEGIDLQYEKLVIRVDRSLILYDEIAYFTNGKKVKLQSRFEPTKMPPGNMIYKRLTMKTLSSGHMTETLVQDEKINTGIKDKVFSRRWLSKDQ